MRSYVSLWSADLLNLGAAMDVVDDVVTGYHLDVFDGHNVRDLLFGPDVVRAVKDRTDKSVEVHLNVDDPHFWVDRFADSGADIISVQSAPCDDVVQVLDHITERGCRPGLGLELHEPVEFALGILDHTDRILLLGTEIGVKEPRGSGTLALRIASHGSTEREVASLIRSPPREPRRASRSWSMAASAHRPCRGWPRPVPTRSFPVRWCSARPIPVPRWRRSLHCRSALPTRTFRRSGSERRYRKDSRDEGGRRDHTRLDRDRRGR